MGNIIYHSGLLLSFETKKTLKKKYFFHLYVYDYEITWPVKPHISDTILWRNEFPGKRKLNYGLKI